MGHTLWLSTQGLLDVQPRQQGRWDYADGVEVVPSVDPEAGDRGAVAGRLLHLQQSAARSEEREATTGGVHTPAWDRRFFRFMV